MNSTAASSPRGSAAPAAMCERRLRCWSYWSAATPASVDRVVGRHGVDRADQLLRLAGLSGGCEDEHVDAPQAAARSAPGAASAPTPGDAREPALVGAQASAPARSGARTTPRSGWRRRRRSWRDQPRRPRLALDPGGSTRESVEPRCRCSAGRPDRQQARARSPPRPTQAGASRASRGCTSARARRGPPQARVRARCSRAGGERVDARPKQRQHRAERNQRRGRGKDASRSPPRSPSRRASAGEDQQREQRDRRPSARRRRPSARPCRACARAPPSSARSARAPRGSGRRRTASSRSPSPGRDR